MTWDEYKKEIKENDPYSAKMLEESERNVEIVSAIIKRRNELGLSQRDLAKMCGMPQSTIARIESLKIVPKMDTLFRIMDCLGIKITLTYA